MSYHVYTTRGLVLSQRPSREADRVYRILTRDLGLIRAIALGVRKEASKLRGALEPVTLSNVSVVRGKEFWRATSAQVVKRLQDAPALIRPLNLLEQLVAGESSHPELFDAVEEAVLAGTTFDEEAEALLVSKILFHLGYLQESDLTLDKKSLIKAINQGLQASHLA